MTIQQDCKDKCYLHVKFMKANFKESRKNWFNKGQRCVHLYFKMKTSIKMFWPHQEYLTCKDTRFDLKVTLAFKIDIHSHLTLCFVAQACKITTHYFSSYNFYLLVILSYFFVLFLYNFFHVPCILMVSRTIFKKT